MEEEEDKALPDDPFDFPLDCYRPELAGNVGVIESLPLWIFEFRNSPPYGPTDGGDPIPRFVDRRLPTSDRAGQTYNHEIYALNNISLFGICDGTGCVRGGGEIHVLEDYPQQLVVYSSAFGTGGNLPEEQRVGNQIFWQNGRILWRADFQTNAGQHLEPRLACNVVCYHYDEVANPPTLRAYERDLQTGEIVRTLWTQEDPFATFDSQVIHEGLNWETDPATGAPLPSESNRGFHSVRVDQSINNSICVYAFIKVRIPALDDPQTGAPYRTVARLVQRRRADDGELFNEDPQGYIGTGIDAPEDATNDEVAETRKKRPTTWGHCRALGGGIITTPGAGYGIHDGDFPFTNDGSTDGYSHAQQSWNERWQLTQEINWWTNIFGQGRLDITVPTWSRLFPLERSSISDIDSLADDVRVHFHRGGVVGNYCFTQGNAYGMVRAETTWPNDNQNSVEDLRNGIIVGDNYTLGVRSDTNGLALPQSLIPTNPPNIIASNVRDEFAVPGNGLQDREIELYHGFGDHPHVLCGKIYGLNTSSIRGPVVATTDEEIFSSEFIKDGTVNPVGITRYDPQEDKIEVFEVLLPEYYWAYNYKISGSFFREDVPRPGYEWLGPRRNIRSINIINDSFPGGNNDGEACINASSCGSERENDQPACCLSGGIEIEIACSAEGGCPSACAEQIAGTSVTCVTFTAYVSLTPSCPDDCIDCESLGIGASYPVAPAIPGAGELKSCRSRILVCGCSSAIIEETVFVPIGFIGKLFVVASAGSTKGCGDNDFVVFDFGPDAEEFCSRESSLI